MKIKTKSVKSTILIVVVVLALIAASRFFGIGTLRSATRTGYIGNEGWRTWSGSYTLLDGNMTHTIRPEGDTLAVTVETKSGTISIEMKDADGNVIFDEDNIGTETFNVDVPGKVIVRIDADNHKGSFNIDG